MIQQAIDIIRRWAANEQITDRTVADNLELIEIRRAATDWADHAERLMPALACPPPAHPQVDLETLHQQLITQVGIFVDVFRQPSQWCYVLRSASSSEVLMGDDRHPNHAGNFASYPDALAAGIKAATEYDKTLIH